MVFGAHCTRALAAGAALLLLAGSPALPAAGASRNRALERAVGTSVYSAGEVERIQRAFAAALQAGVDERDALGLVEAAAADEYDSSHVVRLLTLASQLSLEGLPLAGFIAKVEEGVAKRIDADRVVQAAERRALALNRAKLLLNSLVLQGFGRADRDEILPDLAAALEAGRPQGEAQEILLEGLRAGESPGALRRKLFP